ncbi:hypothetical protein PV04_08151 [Phialophora macrospora]|uniref:Uncharacterized protein n=1 Tax=Phialophora macrospora TaxID=1851006 RepID=A0A0D2FD34_9EURO|nr:hypothetical protein PV04_08151 [Phialophora macrospora]
MPLLKLKLNVHGPPTPSTTPSATTTPLASSPPRNLQRPAEETARHKILYRTSGGTLLNEDISSDARLTAIYAHNALPSQRIYSYARARARARAVATSATTAPTTMVPPPPKEPLYRPNQPPSYVRAGTSLEHWAGERARGERLDKARRVARLQTKLARTVGGLATALEARVGDKARQAGL